MEMKSISDDQSLLVIGATGWVGSEILRQALRSSQWSQVIGTGRDIESTGHLQFSNFQAYNLDLKAENFQLPKAKYMVYSAGSVPHSGIQMESGWQEKGLTRALELFFKNGGLRAFVLSSGSVYEKCEMPDGGYQEKQWTVDLGITASSEYGRVNQKEELVADQFQKQGNQVGVGRLFAALGSGYGENSTFAFVDFIRQHKVEGAIRIQSPSSKRSYLWLPDMARGILQWLLSEGSKSSTFNLTGSGTVSMKDLALGLFPESILIEGTDQPRHYFGDSERMAQLQGFQKIIPTEEAILKMQKELQQ